MTLERQVVEMPFAQGIDTKADPKQIPLGKLLLLENGIFTAPGKIQKRPADQTIPGAAAGAQNAIFTRQNELCAMDGSYNLISYDASNATWISRGKAPSTTVSASALATPQFTTYAPDVAVATNGLICTVYELHDVNAGALKGIGYTIVDGTTGQIVVPPATLDNAASYSVLPRVLFMGSSFVCYYINGDGTTTEGIFGRTLDTTNPTAGWSAATQLTSGTTTSAVPVSVLRCQFDACSSGPAGYLSFNNRSGGTTLFRVTSAAPLTVTNSTNIAATSSIGSCVFFDGINIVLGYFTATVASFAVYSATLGVQVAAPAVVDNTLTAYCCMTGYIGFLFIGNAVSSNVQQIRSVTYNGSYVAAAATTLARSLNIAGKPFVASSGATCLPAWYSPNTVSLGITRVTTPQNCIYLLDSSGNVISKALSGTAGCLDTVSIVSAGAGSSYTLPSSFVSGNTASFPATTSNVLVSSSVIPAWAGYGFGFFGTGSTAYGFFTPSSTALNYNFGTSLLAFSFSSPNSPNTTNSYIRGELANTVHINGGVLQMYDGQNVVEHGFLIYPAAISASTNGSGGSVNAGVHQYIATYEWVDGQGQLHRSTPSSPLSVTALANDKVTITIPTLRVTAKSGVMIQIYRTAANAQTFYQITNFNSAGSLFNDKTVDSVSWVDTQSDAAIAASPQIYTTGNVLPNAPCNPAGSMVVHRNRLFVVDSTNPTQIWFSKTVIAGTPVEFSGFDMLNVDPKGGPVTALASLDDKLIVFKQDRIFMVLGDGPDATGAQNNFTDAMLVSADTGCTAPKGIVLEPNGLIFQGPKGLHELNRALQVSYIGAPVQAYSIGEGSAGAAATAALLKQDGHQAWIMVAGQILVYDYVVGQWGVFKDAVQGLGLDVVNWQGSPVMALNQSGVGMVAREVQGLFGDYASTAYSLKITTGWIKLSGLQGFQRVRRLIVLGDYKSPHTLNVQIAYDYNDAVTQTTTFAVSSDPAPYQFEVHLSNQKCEAVKVTIFDSNQSGTLESMSLSGLGFEIGVKRGMKKLPATQRGG